MKKTNNFNPWFNPHCVLRATMLHYCMGQLVVVVVCAFIPFKHALLTLVIMGNKVVERKGRRKRRQIKI